MQGHRARAHTHAVHESDSRIGQSRLIRARSANEFEILLARLSHRVPAGVALESRRSCFVRADEIAGTALPKSPYRSRVGVALESRLELLHPRG